MIERRDHQRVMEGHGLIIGNAVDRVIFFCFFGVFCFVFVLWVFFCFGGFFLFFLFYGDSY